MRLSKTRTYLEQQVKAVFKDAKPHKDAFNDENIAKTKLADRYFIEYSLTSSEKGQGIVTNTLSASVVMYFEGRRDPREAFDYGMDGMNDVAITCMSLSALAAFRATDDFPLQECNMLSITPEQLETNDNTVKITLELELTLIQSIC